MGKIKILLVDDEKEFVTTLAERMRMRNYDSAFALSGDEALKMLTDKVPDVMIVDLKMPGLDGMEVLRRTKKIAPEIQTIILTGHGSEKDENEARRLGAFEYLKKPIDIQALAQHIMRAYQDKQVKS